MFEDLTGKFSDAFKVLRGNGRITKSHIQDCLLEVRTALLEADVHFDVVKEFLLKVKEKALGVKVLKGVDPQQQFIKICQDQLTVLMGSKHEGLELQRKDLLPILLVGLNGQGKTTFAGKLALYLKNKKKKNILLVPADTIRPAAKDQLKILASQVGVECFDSDLSKTPQEIVETSVAYAKTTQKNIILIDTAGRLQVDAKLMEEIKEVQVNLRKYRPEVLLVTDAMTGQESVNIARSFHEALGLTGIILSKMDSDARGGAALSIRYTTGLPIKYLSVGEKMDDLELFHPDRLAGRILDMGDIVSLVEKAEDRIDKQDSESMMQSIKRGEFSIDDLMKQMEMMSRLGSLKSLVKMLPGMQKMGDLGSSEKNIVKMKVIICSMTKKEKKDYRLVDKSRISRISKGSGTTENDVKNFLSQFKKLKQTLPSMMNMFKGKSTPNFNSPLIHKEKKRKKNKGPYGGGHFFN